jgi:membrane associated rhomboid family serine protease
MATSAEGGGVAWFAHIGGFLAGMILIKPFKALLKR